MARTPKYSRRSTSTITPLISKLSIAQPIPGLLRYNGQNQDLTKSTKPEIQNPRQVAHQKNPASGAILRISLKGGDLVEWSLNKKMELVLRKVKK